MMRDYSKVSGSFWTGKTGRELRGDLQTQVIALYLMTSPHANMIGVFNCPVVYMAHETGSPLEGATKGLQKLCEGGFCTYDEDTEMVWVHEMAKYQIGELLKASDNRVKDIQKQYASIPSSQIKSGFFDKYSKCFHLENNKPLASPLQAPPKPEAGTEAGTEIKPARKNRVVVFPEIQNRQIVDDWLTIRKTKKLPATKTALVGFLREVEKSGLTLEKVLTVCCEKGWAGFNADWPIGSGTKHNEMAGAI